MTHNRRQNNPALEVSTIEREIAAIVAEHPDVMFDDELRADVLEGETQAFEVLSRIINQVQDAETLASAIAERLKGLSTRKAMAEKRAAAYRGLALRIMNAAELRKATLPEATVSVARQRPALLITDETAIPDCLFRIKRELDRTKIRTLIDFGEAVPGAQLGNGGETLTIRVA